MYIFKNQMGMFGYLKIPDVILSLVSSQKFNWTHIFNTHCSFLNKNCFVLWCPVKLPSSLCDLSGLCEEQRSANSNAKTLIEYCLTDFTATSTFHNILHIQNLLFICKIILFCLNCLNKGKL